MHSNRTGTRGWGVRAPLGRNPVGIARNGAFSLIELMVVLMLIGIMTAMIIPQMKGTFEDALLRSTGRKLIDVFNLASSRSITLGQAHRVRLDLKKGHYSVERTMPEREQGIGLIQVPDIPGGDGRIDTRITVEVHNAADDPSEPLDQDPAFVTGAEARNRAKEEAIGFYADGTADAAEIVLRDREGFRLALRINPITARIRIVELERK